MTYKIYLKSGVIINEVSQEIFNKISNADGYFIHDNEFMIDLESIAAVFPDNDLIYREKIIIDVIEIINKFANRRHVDKKNEELVSLIKEISNLVNQDTPKGEV